MAVRMVSGRQRRDISISGSAVASAGGSVSVSKVQRLRWRVAAAAGRNGQRSVSVGQRSVTVGRRAASGRSAGTAGAPRGVRARCGRSKGRACMPEASVSFAAPRSDLPHVLLQPAHTTRAPSPTHVGGGRAGGHRFHLQRRVTRTRTLNSSGRRRRRRRDEQVSN